MFCTGNAVGYVLWKGIPFCALQLRAACHATSATTTRVLFGAVTFHSTPSPLSLPPSPCRQLRTGDVFAVPRGWTAWLWNNQTDRPFSAVAVIDTSLAPPAGPSRVNLFRLMGAQKEGLGGILHGFR